MPPNLDIKTELLHIREDIICGFHSGFPPCCIKFYITKWVWNIGSIFYKEHWKKINKARRSHHIGYIPCPKCLKERNIVKVKKCPANCPKVKLVKEFLKSLKKQDAKLRKKNAAKQTSRNSGQRKRQKNSGKS